MSKYAPLEVVRGVPVFVKLTSYLKEEAKAWEDEWKTGVGPSSLKAYEMNMRVFERMGFWEESGKAAKNLPTDSSMRVLDLGCGNGVSSANIKGKEVIGVDLSLRQLIRAKERFPSKKFIVADVGNLPFRKNTFDLIVAINLLHHVFHPGKVLRDCFRVLKKGGRLLTIDPNLTNPIGFFGRGLYRVLGLKRIFPTYPQFALGEKERQFTKFQYHNLFKKSPFRDYKIIPHRIERILFFATILFPAISQLPFYEHLLVAVSKIGNQIVKIPPFDYLCYFWKGEAVK